MRLLFDENLSYRLVNALDDLYPGSVHVRDLDLLGASDNDLWKLAAESGYIIVSKDTDFFQRSIAYGGPPLTIWLRVGNASTATIEAVLRASHLLIRRFSEDAEAALLILPRT